MISIIHPSRGRPEQAYKTFRKWFYSAGYRYGNGFEYILSLDYDDESNYADDFWKIVYNYNTTAIEAINFAATRANGDYLLIVSDDTDCFENWDVELLKAIKGHKSDFCAKCNDGLQPTLITMPFMDRAYYERYGYVYHPDYKHMFADQELTAVAMMTGKYIKLDLSFPHLHYSTGKTPKDEINVKNDLTWRQGEMLFNDRLKTNFGIENPIMNYSDIQWK